MNLHNFTLIICNPSKTNWHTTIKWEQESSVYYGKLEGISDLISWESPDESGILPAVLEAIHDYHEICKEVGKVPQVPTPPTH